MTDWQSLGLTQATLPAVANLNWKTATPIQQQAIPLALQNRDVIGIAMTGSGKTAAYLLPILEKLAAKPRPKTPRRPKALILVPTRELAQQVGQVANELIGEQDFGVGIVYGGVGYARQRKTLAAGVEILIATPGRLIDLMQQGNVLLDRIAVLVLDEADRMLDMGFQLAIDTILAKTKTDRQSLFFSATFPPSTRRLATKMLVSPAQVAVDAPSSTVESVEQRVLAVRENDKLELLKALLLNQLPQHRIETALVFVNSRSCAGRVARFLNADQRTESTLTGSVAMMHGGISQSNRDAVLKELKDGDVKTLVATDVASRGIDFDSLSHVINYDVPLSIESYVHRIGRTARAGQSGTALTLATTGDVEMLDAIERQIGQTLAIDSQHRFHIELPSEPFKKRGRHPDDGGPPIRGLEHKRQRTASGKSAVVEYKVGKRRRSISGKVRKGRPIRSEKSKFLPAWKKRTPGE